MMRLKQFRRLLEERTYRIRVAFFFLVSAVLFLASLLMAPPIWKEILLEFSITFGAVGLLQLLWDFLGGEPLGLRMGKLEGEVRGIQSSVRILTDLADGNIGLERIWKDRDRWQGDKQDGLAAWQERVCQAKKVDILSNTLWTNWMMNPMFRQRFFNHIEKGAEARILVYEPGSLVQQLRAADETRVAISAKAMIESTLLWLARAEQDTPGSMEAEIEATLLRLGEDDEEMPGDMEKEIIDTLKEASACENLQVRLTHFSLHFAQIIRADDRMLVATYLAGKGGSPSPTMQLRGRESSHFKTYEEQIDKLWNRAKTFDAKQQAKTV